MGTVMLFYAGMALIIAVIFYVGYRVDKKNRWRREKNDTPPDNQLDPKNL